MPVARAPAGSPPGKLRPPRLGRSFDRERLFARLDGETAAGLWLVGPPGVGKTTLVATYLQARAVRCVWLQLDGADADPATFAHFVRAAAPRAPATRASRQAPPSADDLRDVPAYLRRCLRHLAARLEPPWALVLDNAQALGADSAVHAGVAAALAELPDGARLIALSREAPPPAYARSLALQQLAVLGEDELRFDDAETARLVALHGRAWPAATLRRATDGWAAAMVLLLAARAQPGPDEALRSGTARARLHGFFASEVLAGMGAADTAALLRIAYLPSATAATAVAVSGHPGAGELLADLARRSLFTERRDGDPAAYSFHALFGDFLRARAAAAWSPAQRRAVRVDAARLLAAHGEADAAIALLIDAGAWPAALASIVEHAGAFFAQGRTAQLRGWLLALPERVRDRPEAWYWLGCCALADDPVQALAWLARARPGPEAGGRGGRGARRDAPARAWGSFLTAAAAADAIVSIGADLHALDPWLAPLRAQAAAYLAQHDAATDLRVLPGLLAAFVHRDTGHPLTAALADRAERLLDRPVAAGQRILLGALAYYLLWTGQTPRLDRMLVKIDRLCADGDAAAGTLLRWYGVSVTIRALRGDVDGALRHARRALALADAGPPAPRAKAQLLVVLAAIAGRDAALARAHLAEAALQLDAGHAIDATTYEFQRGLLLLLEADWTGAERLMRAAVASGRASGWPLREHIALLGQALAATQCGRLDLAEDTLRAVREHPFHAVCRWHHWLAELIEAHLARCRGDTARAVAALRRAFEVGRAGGFDYGPLPYCCGDTMPRLAALALAHGVDPAFALHLVRRHALPAPPGADERWPWPIRVRTLGAFAVERDGQGAPAARKESRRPLDLLKLVVAHGAVTGGAPAPVDALCAALWPDAEGDAARNAFDTTVHRLRRLLGDERRAVLHGGALALNAGSCWCDALALQACLAEADAAAATDDLPRTRALAERALALYGGPFLPGDDEPAAVVAARARLDARLARALAGAGARLEAAGDAAEAARLYARVLEVQPLAEDTCRRLMACLLGLGRRAEAYDAYRRCRQQLSVLLGLAPDARTEALAASLRGP